MLQLKQIKNNFQLKKREGEWFELTDEDVKTFTILCEEKEATMNFLKQNNYF